MTKITLKIQMHYGNKDLKTIMEDLVSKKLVNFKFNNGGNDNAYYNMDFSTTDAYKERSKL